MKVTLDYRTQKNKVNYIGGKMQETKVAKKCSEKPSYNLLEPV